MRWEAVATHLGMENLGDSSAVWLTPSPRWQTRSVTQWVEMEAAVVAEAAVEVEAAVEAAVEADMADSRQE